MKEFVIEIEYTEELLGTCSADPEIHRRFVASKAEDAPKMAEEVAALGVDAVEERATTVFPRNEKGEPFLWDYQFKGFLKDSAGMLRRADDTVCKKVKAYKKEVDGLIYPMQRRIPLVMPEGAEMGRCERPLRASTPQGERVALASSETVPEGTTMRFGLQLLRADLLDFVVECLDYGQYHGMGQWRNSGKGRFLYRMLDREGNQVAGNM